MCEGIFPAYMSMYPPGEYLRQWPGESIRSPGTGVTNVSELPCGCWESYPGPLEERPVLLTAEPPLRLWFGILILLLPQMLGLLVRLAMPSCGFGFGLRVLGWIGLGWVLVSQCSSGWPGIHSKLPISAS